MYVFIGLIHTESLIVYLFLEMFHNINHSGIAGANLRIIMESGRITSEIVRITVIFSRIIWVITKMESFFIGHYL